MLSTATAGALWRRAIEALAHAFDPARETGHEETVFQTAAAPRREGDDPPPRPPEETRR